MRGYMPNIDGTDELEPNGVVAVLTDEDGDGRMDTREVFLDELVLPRAIHPFDGGCLILAPPELALWRDTDGDGRADSREVIDTGLAGLDNPEHAINGLLYQLDNSVRVANASKRYVRGPEGCGSHCWRRWVRPRLRRRRVPRSVTRARTRTSSSSTTPRPRAPAPPRPTSTSPRPAGPRPSPSSRRSSRITRARSSAARGRARRARRSPPSRTFTPGPAPGR